MKLLWSLVLAFVVVSPAVADYRSELSLSYAEVFRSETFNSAPEPEELDLAFTVYLQPVDDSKGPLGEAAFLARASSARYSYNKARPDMADFSSQDSHALSVRYVARESGWLTTLSGNIVDPSVMSSGDGDGFGVAAGFGKYLNDSTTLELQIGYSESDLNTLNELDCAVLPFISGCDRVELRSEIELETIDVSARLRRVGSIGNQIFGTTLRLGYGISDVTAFNSGLEVITDPPDLDPLFPSTPRTNRFKIKNNWNFLAAGTWFPVRQLGIDLQYDLTASQNREVHGVGVGFGWFASPNIELRGAFAVRYPEREAKMKQWRLTLRARI